VIRRYIAWRNAGREPYRQADNTRVSQQPNRRRQTKRREQREE